MPISVDEAVSKCSITVADVTDGVTKYCFFFLQVKESSSVDGPDFFSFFRFSWSSSQLDFDAFDEAFDTVYQFQQGLTGFTGETNHLTNQPTESSTTQNIYSLGDSVTVGLLMTCCRGFGSSTATCGGVYCHRA